MAMAKGRQASRIWPGRGGSPLSVRCHPDAPTGQLRSSLCRFGGVIVVLSILWGWQIDKVCPDKFDLVGGSIALLGVLVIMYWPRN